MESNVSQVISHRKIVTSVGLAAVAAVHIIDLPGKWEEVRYLGIAYLFLIAGSFFVMERIIVHGKKIDFQAAAGLSLAVIIAYVINRTVGMPGAMDDIGNWLEPLGLFSVFLDAYVLWNAFRALKELSA